MPTIEHSGKSFEVDEDAGCLINPKDWCEEWVNYVANQEGINDVTDEHRKVMEAMRAYQSKNGCAPFTRILSSVTGVPLRRMYELFPSGPGKGACRMAGLQRPSS